MSNFNNKSITNKGLELLSAAMAGSKLEFTRIVMGSGTYSGDIGVIESLVNQKQSLDIKSITKKGSQVILSTTLLQSAITEDFYWKEIGVYAKGSDNLEVLYMYGSATDTSFISKDMLNEKMINVGVLVSNAQNVSATIDGSLVYLSRADLEAHNNDETAHKSLRSWVQSLFDSLKLTWDSITGKPDTFPPSEHGHTASQITGLPTSLPANGGNADTVDGKHASDFLQTTGGTVNGDVTVTQSLSARKLQLTDYGTPLECGKYLDFHDVGSSNSDYDGRLYVHGAHLAYANGNGVTMVITDEINNLNSKVLEMEKKLGGDYMGKDMVILTKQALSLNVPFTYTNSKGGILRVETPNTGVTTTITVDGSVMSSGRAFSDICNLISSADGYYGYELIIPFNSSVSLTPTSSGITIYPVAYVNK